MTDVEGRVAQIISANRSLLLVLAVCLLAASPAGAVILHTDDEPALKPESAVVAARVGVDDGGR